MNALPAREFAVVDAPTTQWLVLLCPPSRTLSLAAALAYLGAWTPTWTRRRRMPRSPMTKPVTEACMAGFVFVPTSVGYILPPVPRIRYRPMQIEGVWTRIADRDLEPLRSIADKPLLPAHKLPRPGQRMRFTSGPFQGLFAKVIRCTQRAATVQVEHGTSALANAFARPIEVPPCILSES